MGQQPYEIIAGPAELYLAPVGEAFPAIGTEPPGGNWTLIATLGTQEYGEEGVTVSHEESVEDFRGLGSTGPIKSFRTEEELTIAVMVHDLTLEEYAKAFDFVTVATDSDDKTMDIYKSHEVAYRALLVRTNGLGPYGANYNLQYEVPRVRSDSTPEVVFQKGIPVGLALQFRALEDLSAASESARFGIIRTQFQN